MCNFLRVEIVKGTRLLLGLAAGALLLLQFADCASSMALDQRSMQCCGSMPCMPANPSHDCCKTMIPAHPATPLPSTRAPLFAPAVASIEPTPIRDVVCSATAHRVMVKVQQHSPPSLYMLHSSLLI